MNTIVAVTDFSSVAANAVAYAADLAVRAKARLILLHVFFPPVSTPDTLVIMPGVQELHQDSVKELRSIAAKTHRLHPRLNVHIACRMGFATDEIIAYAASEHADLIVAGTHGAGFVKEKFLGSVTASLISKSSIAVLAVPNKAKLKSIRRIALACDFQETGDGTLDPLLHIAELYDARVDVLNVSHALEPSTTGREVVSEYGRLESALKTVDHAFHYLENESVTAGLTAYVKETHCDMIAMVPRKHTLLARIFSEPDTRRMSFHVKVPLLTLHSTLNEP